MEAKVFKLEAQGVRLSVTNWGATILGVEVPDRNGNWQDIIVGYDSLEDLKRDNFYMGSSIGRVGNRIAKGQFSLEGKTYQLQVNNGPNHLHGGDAGFHNKVWEVASVSDSQIKFRYTSPDGDGGFPGKVEVTATYSLVGEQGISLEYEAVTDQATPLNMVQHAYWNLSGDPATKIHEHTLRIAASSYLPLDENSIPTGEIADVADTHFDLQKAARVGDGLENACEQIQMARGYDHCFVFDDSDESVMVLRDPASGRSMQLKTNQPGVQVYTANYLDDETVGKKGIPLGRQSCVCLETQALPNAVNESAFPSVIVRPGETYQHSMHFTFGTC